MLTQQDVKAAVDAGTMWMDTQQKLVKRYPRHEDAVADATLAAIGKALGQPDGAFATKAKLAAWVRTVAENAVKDSFKASKVREAINRTPIARVDADGSQESWEDAFDRECWKGGAFNDDDEEPWRRHRWKDFVDQATRDQVIRKALTEHLETNRTMAQLYEALPPGTTFGPGKANSFKTFERLLLAAQAKAKKLWEADEEEAERAMEKYEDQFA